MRMEVAHSVEGWSRGSSKKRGAAEFTIKTETSFLNDSNDGRQRC